MIAPPPPKAAVSTAPVAPAPTNVSATAAPTENVAAPAAETKTRKVIAKFGKAKGEGAVTIPNINGIDAKKLFEAFKATCAACGVTDLAEAVKAFDATPKSAFPGNKEGRAAYAVGGVLKNILKVDDSLHKERATGEKKARVKQTDLFKDALKRLMGKFGSMDEMYAMLGDDVVKKLKLNEADAAVAAITAAAPVAAK